MVDTHGVSGFALPIVYADETHNTGENLVDLTQPVFAVGGVHLNDDEAQEIVARVINSRKGAAGEPKYANLARRAFGRNLLMPVYRQLHERAAVKVALSDKRYVTVAKIVDLVLEPLAYADGHRMHEDGSAKSLAHIVHFYGPRDGARQQYDEMLRAFVRLIRDGISAIPNYFRAVDKFILTLPPESRDFYKFPLRPVDRRLFELAAERVQGIHPDTLDPAVPTLVRLCDAFSKELGEFKLMHDESKVIHRHKSLLLNLAELPNPMDPENKTTIGSASEIEFVDSRSAPQLQIVDWVVGAARDCGMSLLDPPRKVVDQELMAIVQDWFVGGVWPSHDELLEQLGSSARM